MKDTNKAEFETNDILIFPILSFYRFNTECAMINADCRYLRHSRSRIIDLLCLHINEGI